MLKGLIERWSLQYVRRCSTGSPRLYVFGLEAIKPHPCTCSVLGYTCPVHFQSTTRNTTAAIPTASTNKLPRTTKWVRSVGLLCVLLLKAEPSAAPIATPRAMPERHRHLCLWLSRRLAVDYCA